jgi:protein phosphatase
MTDHNLEQRDAWREAISSPLDIAAFHPLSSTFGVELAAVSSGGATPSHDTDHYLAVRLGRLQETIVTSLAAADLPPRFEEHAYAMFVADGLGGEGSSVRASRLALSTLAHLAIQYGQWNVRVEPSTTVDIIGQTEFLYREINGAVRAAKRANGPLADLATSLTAVYIAGAHLFFAQVGHSRAYLFRRGELTQLTTDHTLEQMRLEGLTPTLLDQSKRDQQHVVTETIGGRHDAPEVVVEHVQLWTGDRVLLCTNGLTDVVSEDRIADVLASQRRPIEECRRLVELALEAGAPDNVTVLLGDYSIPSSARGPTVPIAG